MPNALIGTWKLVSFELRSADGKVHYPFGEKVSGHIIYSEDGCMSVTMSAANRPRCEAKGLRLATTEEKAAATDTSGWSARTATRTRTAGNSPRTGLAVIATRRSPGPAASSPSTTRGTRLSD